MSIGGIGNNGVGGVGGFRKPEVVKNEPPKPTTTVSPMVIRIIDGDGTVNSYTDGKDDKKEMEIDFSSHILRFRDGNGMWIRTKFTDEDLGFSLEGFTPMN